VSWLEMRAAMCRCRCSWRASWVWCWWRYWSVRWCHCCSIGFSCRDSTVSWQRHEFGGECGFLSVVSLLVSVANILVTAGSDVFPSFHRWHYEMNFCSFFVCACD